MGKMHRGKRSTILIQSFILAFAFVSHSWAGSDVKTIDTARLHSMIMDNAYRLEAGREPLFTVIDARTKEEYDEAHIFSAVSIPEAGFGKSMNLLPKDKTALLTIYCSDTPDTCGKWADKTAAAGYMNLVIYSEGFSAWKKKHMPVAPVASGLHKKID